MLNFYLGSDKPPPPPLLASYIFVCLALFCIARLTNYVTIVFNVWCKGKTSKMNENEVLPLIGKILV